jgi:lipid A oxidase
MGAWARSTVSAEPFCGTSIAARLDRLGAIVAIVLIMAVAADVWLASPLPDDSPAERAATSADTGGPSDPAPGRETFLAGYIGVPDYYCSHLDLQRPDGTDLHLKCLGWDGDAARFPIDGGVRSVEWPRRYEPFGFMVDFLHNKAIARLGRGAHGRRLRYPVIEEVPAEGTLKGQPAPPRIKLTDIFERLEFTHGHNVLLFTPMFRPLPITPRLRPYFGLGGGFALPHVEVWFPGEEPRTDEYQFAGPAAQMLAGIEIRTGRMSYFFEYKFTWAWIRGALTGDKSWQNWFLPGDLWRQFTRWWRGEQPKLGTFETHLSSHQIFVGAGYWWQRGTTTAAP